MDPDETYQLLRHLTSPIVAVTATHEGRANGQIANSALRASLVPGMPRVMVQLARYHLTHDMVLASGAFCLHLLRTEQLELVYRLGFLSGHDDRRKLQDGEWRALATGSPVLKNCYAFFDCSLWKAVDMGPSTLVVGRILEAGRGSGGGEVMTSAEWRANMPEEWRPAYEADLREAQRFAEEYVRDHPEAL